ncbi:serine hydrolase domain-containing protein [Flavobacterium pectinovorum]|uniref:Class A beta-lactamase-related serine hydrolase n=1 Tax=Flavobacterium pectinovorum TaxID=29533 RepID=A0A502EC58_9FLAO|nr:serine hydrolase domain-containing protein [Flavobacterium pectinovorum]TPG33971.1 class A beta-lactamase-related serine hydrolase [Flavobacterium pectinovorum]
MKTSVKLLAAVLLVSTFSFGQDITRKIDSIIKDNYQKNPNVGISVGFIQNNKEFYTSYGKLNAESKTEINKNSIFEIASITKILTTNLIAQAALENKLKLEDYIDNYLPKEYVLNENLKNKIRISDLASHQSGLPDIDFAKLIELNPQQPISNVTEQTLTTLINNCTELKDYGKYRYSTIGFTLLGQILEKVYGKSYDEIIREKIINPVHMTHTLTEDFDVKNRTVGHNPDGGIQEFIKWNITSPAGLVKSNATDMVKYLKAILNKETTVGKAALVTEKTFYKVDNRELGLGINIDNDDKTTLYMKSGDSMGQSCIICYNRAKNWGIIILLDKRDSKIRSNLLDTITEKVMQ